MQQRLTFITLGVKDLTTSIHFYENILGWKRTNDSNENIVFFQLNGIRFSLYDRNALADDATVDANGSGFAGFTVAQVLPSIAEVDALFEELRRKKVAIVKEPHNAFWGGYSGYFSDPDGFLWEIAYNPFLELDANGNAI